MKTLVHATEGDTYNESCLLHQSLKNAHIVDCQGSIWLYELRGVIPLLLSFNDMIPSRYFRCVVLFSRPIIFASPQLISDVHVELCFVNLPSPVFILLFNALNSLFIFSSIILVLVVCDVIMTFIGRKLCFSFNSCSWLESKRYRLIKVPIFLLPVKPTGKIITDKKVKRKRIIYHNLRRWPNITTVVTTVWFKKEFYREKKT